jgi:hypothetical protein
VSGLDWAGVPDPADIPQPKFRLQWVADDTALVIAVAKPPPSKARYLSEISPKIGEVFFNGSEWVFEPFDLDGKRASGDKYLPVDPEQEQRFKDEEARIRTELPDTSANLPLIRELQGRRERYRDDSRDDATIHALVEASRWWKLLWTEDRV